ncbi:MAG: MFS transporter [Kofleriaceae bacterium]
MNSAEHPRAGGEPNRFARAELHVLWVLWLTYGAFYFCRTNLSTATHGIEQDLGLSTEQVGVILGSLKLTYGIGQLINGQLAERISPRRMLAIGMFGSAALNIVFGLGTGFYFLLFVWACNGYCQSLGWAPTMRITAGWFPAIRRGRAIAWIGTGYQLLAALTYVVTGWAVQYFGWRGAVFVPAALLAAAGIYMLVALEEAPVDRPAAVGREAAGTWKRTVAITLGNGRLWLLALALGLVNACRYGFLDWGVRHLLDVQGAPVSASALKNAVVPLGGVVGTLAAGWATDKYFGGRRIPVMVGMLVALAALVVGYEAIVETNPIASVVALALIGALLFGPQVLLVGTTPVDLARAGTAAAACGFVNFVGYLGAAAGDVVTGHLAHHHGWQIALWFWAACAAGAALAVLPLWRAMATRTE